MTENKDGKHKIISYLLLNNSLIVPYVIGGVNMSNSKNNSVNELERKSEQTGYAINCKHCGGKIFHLQKRHNKIFCSTKCRLTWWNANLDIVKREAFYNKVCFRCGKPFTVYGRGGAKFCSKNCYQVWRRNKNK